MLRIFFVACAFCLGAVAAERKFEFTLSTNANALPTGFRSTVSGMGQPGGWKVILDDASSALPALSSRALVTAKQAVLAQLTRDRTDEHFPLLLLDDETFRDFRFTTRLKMVAGETEQMAGLAFRIQNENNYYVVRASALGNNVRFYKFVNGQRSAPIGPDLTVASNVWHDLTVECKGNQIRVWFNGKEAMPALTDTSFGTGKIGFWTKSDSVSYFAGARIEYTVQERLVDQLVNDTIKKYGKLRGLKLFALMPGTGQPQVVASSQAGEVGQPGGEDEKTCIKEGTPYVGRGRDVMVIMMPLRDRNGDVVAAARVTHDTFLGQTENNALARTRPIIKFMESRLANATEGLQ